MVRLILRYVLCFIGVCFGALQFVVPATAADTLPRATRIDLGHTGPAPQFYYQFINDHKLLFAADDGNRVYLRDLRTHRTRRIKSPPHRLGHRKNYDVYNSHDVRYPPEVSPNGRWVLWLSDDQFTITVVSLDGRHTIKRDHRADTEDGFWFQWLPDSLHWIEFETWGMASPLDSDFTAALSSRTDPKLIRGLAPAAKMDMPHEAVGSVFVTPDSRVLASSAHFYWSTTLHVNIYECGMDRNKTPFHHHPVDLPAGAVIPPNTDPRGLPYVAFSPQGDRILWHFAFGLPITEEPPESKSRASGRDELWVSRIDGSGLHPIWRQQAQRGEPIESACWLPSGRGVSFVQGHNLWTIPTP